MWLLFAPSYYGLEVSAVAVSPSGEMPKEKGKVIRQTRATLLEVNGPHVIPILASPPLLLVFGLGGLGLKMVGPSFLGTVILWAAVALLLGFCALGVFSVGLFFLPSFLALLGCALMSRRNPLGSMQHHKLEG
ncbi:MAG: hypothetical protein HY676_05665 [Chloroflexi bacterium]|nr:hypothetical protein [Chloroflexota bacterium]